MNVNVLGSKCLNEKKPEQDTCSKAGGDKLQVCLMPVLAPYTDYLTYPICNEPDLL